MSKPYKHVCQNCGKEYLSANNTASCSIACRDESLRKRKLEKAEVAPCPVCGETKPLLRTSYGVKVCSKQCVGLDQHRKWVASHRESQRGKRERWGPQGRVKRLKDSASACALCGTLREELQSAEEMGYATQGLVGKHVFHVDHIQPLSKGGSEEMENVRILCWFCNRARGTMTKHDEAIAAAGKAFWDTVHKKQTG